MSLLRRDDFEQVALPHVCVLLRFALRLTRNRSAAEDLVQETLMLAWRGFHQLESRDRVRAWVFSILVNTFKSQRRKAQSCPEHLELTDAVCGTFPSGTGHTEVLQAFDRLSRDHRIVLILSAVEGFTCREIAEMLSLPIGTVMSRLSRARKAIRTELSRNEEVMR